MTPLLLLLLVVLQLTSRRTAVVGRTPGYSDGDLGLGDGGGVDLGLDASSGMGGRYGSDSSNHEVVVDPMALHLQQPQVLQDDPTAWAPPQLRRGQQRLGFNKHAIVTGYS